MIARHNAVRDWSCATYSECTGLPATTEQHVPQWDLVDEVSGEVEEARLDVATSDVDTGAPLFLDVVIKCAFSSDTAVLHRRARRNGLVASDGAASKPGGHQNPISRQGRSELWPNRKNFSDT